MCIIIVMLGSPKTGKSGITLQYVKKLYSDSYNPTLRDSFRKMITLENKTYTVEILDTSGAESFEAVNDLYLKQGHGFVLVYSVEDMSSFHQIEMMKEELLRIHNKSTVPMILVGNKCDSLNRKVSFEEGEKLSKELGDCPFMEASAKSKENIEELFKTILAKIVQSKNKQESIPKKTYDKKQKLFQCF